VQTICVHTIAAGGGNAAVSAAGRTAARGWARDVAHRGSRQSIQAHNTSTSANVLTEEEGQEELQH